VERSESISKRLESARCVVRKERRILVTRRLEVKSDFTKNDATHLSTLLSDEFFRNRLKASVRCSFVTTAES